MSPPGSVGLVRPSSIHFDTPIRLRSGAELPQFDLVYVTYGALNEARSNAVPDLLGRQSKVLFHPSEKVVWVLA